METTNATTPRAEPESVRAPIRARVINFQFGPEIPRYWLFGSPRATHIANGVNLLFPLGERFFIRSVRAYVDRLTDPALAAQVRGFMAQEVRHGIEHERFFESLRAHGYEIDEFLADYEAFAFGKLEKHTPKALNLAITVALEHFTAVLAARALTVDVLDHAHPIMADLLRWHAAEEIEHKAVAFDVLQAVHPSYAIRIVGLGFAGALLGAYWAKASAMLRAQDRAAGRREPEPHLPELRARHDQMRGALLRAAFSYLRPGFHPNDHADASLADEFFARWTRVYGAKRAA